MPRYIDLEELEKRINENIKPETLEEKALIEWCKDECIRQAYCMPAAYAAPRAEVEREIGEEIYRIIGDAYNDAWVCLLVRKLADKLIKGHGDGQ